jgi:small subunit ribosomal protein S1
VSELSHARVGHPSEILQPNQEVEVEVTKIDAGDPKSPDKNKQKERIGLSLRALEADPWANLEERFPIGSHLKAKVVRLQPFGAFVALAPGVDGLIHISNLSDKRISHPKDVVAEGQEIEVVVEKLEPENRKIGLALWREGYTAPAVAAPLTDAPSAPKPQPIKRAQVGDVVEATVDKVEPFGLFISFPSGRGLVPNVEMGTPFGTDHKKMFPPGSTFKAIVLEIDQQGRLRLSKAGVERAEERAEVSKWQAENAPKGSGKSGFGTLGDLLKAKLNK